MPTSAHTSTREGLLYLQVNLGQNASLDRISKEMLNISNLVTMCEKLVLSSNSGHTISDAQLNWSIGNLETFPNFYKAAKSGLSRESTGLQHALRVKALAEHHEISLPKFNPQELARIATETHEKTKTRLLGVRTMRYKNPLELIMEVLPTIMTDDSLKAHGTAALSVLGLVLAGIRKWQSSGQQLKLQDLEIEKRKLDIEIKGRRDKIATEAYRKKTEISIEIANQFTELFRNEVASHSDQSNTLETQDILKSVSEHMCTNLLRLPEDEVIKGIEACTHVSDVSAIKIDQQDQLDFT